MPAVSQCAVSGAAAAPEGQRFTFPGRHICKVDAGLFTCCMICQVLLSPMLQGAVQAEGQPLLPAQRLVAGAADRAHPLPAHGGPHLQLHRLLLGR